MILEALALGALLCAAGMRRPRIRSRHVIYVRCPQPPTPLALHQEPLPSGARNVECPHMYERDPMRMQRECVWCGDVVTDMQWYAEGGRCP